MGVKGGWLGWGGSLTPQCRDSASSLFLSIERESPPTLGKATPTLALHKLALQNCFACPQLYWHYKVAESFVYGRFLYVENNLRLIECPSRCAFAARNLNFLAWFPHWLKTPSATVNVFKLSFSERVSQSISESASQSVCLFLSVLSKWVVIIENRFDISTSFSCSWFRSILHSFFQVYVLSGNFCLRKTFSRFIAY